MPGIASPVLFECADPLDEAPAVAMPAMAGCADAAWDAVDDDAAADAIG
jgi:hypothetical protein